MASQGFRDAIDAAVSLVFPRVCLSCGRTLLRSERCLCATCIQDLPRCRFALQRHNPMADKFNARFDNDTYEPFSYAAALFFYPEDSLGEDVHYDRITKAIKYNSNFEAASLFSDLLAEELASSPLFSDVDMVIPVPLHFLRHWKRGYNQAELIARSIARRLDAGLCTKTLKRRRRTRSQATLPMESKASNVQGAFVLRDNKSKQRLPKEPRHILLVDDVFTSGSTLDECRKALRRRYGMQVRISIATLAFVGAV